MVGRTEIEIPKYNEVTNYYIIPCFLERARPFILVTGFTIVAPASKPCQIIHRIVVAGGFAFRWQRRREGLQGGILRKKNYAAGSDLELIKNLTSECLMRRGFTPGHHPQGKVYRWEGGGVRLAQFFRPRKKKKRSLFSSPL